jgi:hypothetical protein
VDGRFELGLWVPSDTACQLHSFTPVEAHFALLGLQVVFIGDSIMRQMFQRLIWHLRDLTAIAEHYYHINALYTRNATHDLLAIDPAVPFEQERFSILNPLFKLFFLWSPHVGPDAQALLRLNNDTQLRKVVVWGINHHPAGDYDFRQTTRDLEPLVPWLHRLVLFAAPERNSLNGDCFSVPTEYAEKNAFLREWTVGKGGLVIPADRMERTHVFARNTEVRAGLFVTLRLHALNAGLCRTRRTINAASRTCLIPCLRTGT